MGMDNDLENSWMEMLRIRFPDSIVAVQAYDPDHEFIGSVSILCWVPGQRRP